MTKPEDLKNIKDIQMRNIIVLILITISICGCNQNSKREIKNNSVNDTITKNEKTITKCTLNNKLELINIKELNKLIPIDTVGPKSNNVYERYGLEFSGNCYDCDLAVLTITDKSIKLTNVCGKEQNQIYEVIKVTNFENRIELKTKHNDFIFTKIDNAPIYELKIIGSTIKNDELRISNYFTLEKILNKFAIHDCGDFQG
jgi:hypothetical protein